MHHFPRNAEQGNQRRFCTAAWMPPRISSSVRAFSIHFPWGIVGLGDVFDELPVQLLHLSLRAGAGASVNFPLLSVA
jgi:hypothetical protein